MGVSLGKDLDPSWCWEMTPVDFVAASCVALADADAGSNADAGSKLGDSDRPLACRCYHVANHDGSIPVPDIALAIREDAGFSNVKSVDYPTFRSILVSDCAGKEGGNPLHTLLHMFQPTSSGLFIRGGSMSKATDAVLQRIGLRPPRITRTMIAAAVQSLHRRGFIASPSTAPIPAATHSE